MKRWKFDNKCIILWKILIDVRFRFELNHSKYQVYIFIIQGGKNEGYIVNQKFFHFL